MSDERLRARERALDHGDSTALTALAQEYTRYGDIDGLKRVAAMGNYDVWRFADSQVVTLLLAANETPELWILHKWGGACDLRGYAVRETKTYWDLIDARYTASREMKPFELLEVPKTSKLRRNVAKHKLHHLPCPNCPLERTSSPKFAVDQVLLVEPNVSARVTEIMAFNREWHYYLTATVLVSHRYYRRKESTLLELNGGDK